jgi:hypothetical protein
MAPSTASSPICRSLLVAICLASGCAFEPLDPDQHECPCPTGWSCVPGIMRCVEGDIDAGDPDAGPQADAGPRDGGAMDGGRGDAGSGDAGSGDAGSGDAGSSDAGSADGGVPASVCDTVSGALFCEGFESTSPGVTLSDSRYVMRVTDAPWRGQGALRASYSGAGTRGFASATFPGVPAAGGLWVTMYERHDPEMVGDGFSTLFIRGETAGRTPAEVQLVWTSTPSSGDVALLYYQPPTGPPIQQTSTAATSVDVWHCVEVHVVGGASGTFELYVDGARQINASGLATDSIERFVGLDLGTRFVQPTEPVIDA